MSYADFAYATIKTYTKSCNAFNECEYEEPIEYTADELGMFDIAITPGETVLFAVSYDGHDICYAGTDISDGCVAKDLSSPLSVSYDRTPRFRRTAMSSSKQLPVANILFFKMLPREQLTLTCTPALAE